MDLVQDDPMDIELDVQDDIAEQQAQQAIAATNHIASAAAHDSATPSAQQDSDIPEAYKQDFDKDIPVPNKIHIKGLDELDARGLETYLEAHTGAREWKHIEWIDDTSANIVWDRLLPASTVLDTFSLPPNQDPSDYDTSLSLAPTDIRPALPYPGRPDIHLSLRQAVVGDKKIKGAKDRSRFYLMHPDHDPDNRRSDNRRRGAHRRHSPRREPRMMTFTADMYDDDDGSSSMSQPVSRDADHERERDLKRNQFKELFENGSTDRRERLRDRSRSPDRDGDGRYGFAEDQPVRKTARPRSRSPLASRQKSSSTINKNANKELFPEHDKGRAGDLFPEHAKGRAKELFPEEHPGRLASRLASPDNSVSDGLSIKGAAARNSNESGISIKGKATAPDDFSIRGRVASSEDYGISIKGRATAPDDFSLKGAASSRKLNNKVKELFPDHAKRNAGKELFADAPGGGRRLQRRRAEDLF